MENLEKILTLTDRDIFPNPILSEDINYTFRLVVRLIIFDHDNKLALVGTKYRWLPGGGVEEGENLMEACIRETREEVGVNLTEIKEIALTEEFRAKIGRHQETHFFTAKVVGKKGKIETTQADELGLEVEWHTLEDAVKLLEQEVRTIPFESYHACFNIRTHLAVLMRLKNLAI